MSRSGLNNKGGRPKGKLGIKGQEAKIFHEYLLRKVLEEKEPIIRALIEKAKKSDVPAIRELFDRSFGRAVESLMLTGNEGGPIQLEYSLDEAIKKAYGDFNRKTELDK